MSSPPVRPSNTISKLNTSVDGGHRYKGILTFTGPTELSGKVTIDPGYLLDDVVPTEFGVRRHERSPNPGDEPIPCEFGIYRLRGLDYYVHSVVKPGTNKLVIPPPWKAAPRELQETRLSLSNHRFTNKMPPGLRSCGTASH